MPFNLRIVAYFDNFSIDHNVTFLLDVAVNAETSFELVERAVRFVLDAKCPGTQNDFVVSSQNERPSLFSPDFQVKDPLLS